MADEYKIGTTAEGLALLSELTTAVTFPKHRYSQGQAVSLPNGGTRYVGYAKAVWHWDFLPQAMRDQLRTYCTGASAEVYIRTRKSDTADAFANLRVMMNWPAEEEKDATRRIPFDISFTVLEEIAEE
jgi:hypothetical protein